MDLYHMRYRDETVRPLWRYFVDGLWWAVLLAAVYGLWWGTR